MRRKLLPLICVVVLGAAVTRCSSTAPNPLETFLRNLNAQQCYNQPATLANLPLGLITPAQGAQILASACAALFGTAPAPTPAPGNNPVFPGAQSSTAPSSAPTITESPAK